MITLKNVSRYKAASVHLAISAGVAVLVLSVMLVLWYPGPLFAAMGGMKLIALIVGVDVFIGPLITMIIFDTRKKELAFDLMVVAALQLAALGYGIHVMHAARPVFTVFWDRQFIVLSQVDVTAKDLSEARIEEFRHLSLTGPRLVAATLPPDPRESALITFANLTSMLPHRPKYFIHYADAREKALKASHPLADLTLDSGEKERLALYLKHSDRKPEELRCLPVQALDSRLLAVIDARSGDLADILDINPHFAH